MPSISPTLRNRSVSPKSSGDGSGFPEGWLCAMTNRRSASEYRCAEHLARVYLDASHAPDGDFLDAEHAVRHVERCDHEDFTRFVGAEHAKDRLHVGGAEYGRGFSSARATVAPHAELVDVPAHAANLSRYSDDDWQRPSP
jgi:hypothetical protein